MGLPMGLPRGLLKGLFRVHRKVFPRGTLKDFRKDISRVLTRVFPKALCKDHRKEYLMVHLKAFLMGPHKACLMGPHMVPPMATPRDPLLGLPTLKPMVPAAWVLAWAMEVHPKATGVLKWATGHSPLNRSRRSASLTPTRCPVRSK